MTGEAWERLVPISLILERKDTMDRRPATVTQADIARAIRAAKQAGAESVEVRPDGSIIVLLRNAPVVSVAPTEIIWTADHIKKFCAVASHELQFALLLALWTGQRQGDLIRLTWMQYDGSKIRVKQGKGKKIGRAHV